MATADVSEGFLEAPAKDIRVRRVDFRNTDVPQYHGLYAVILDDVLSVEECKTLIRAAEASTNKGWERAMINIGGEH